MTVGGTAIGGLTDATVGGTEVSFIDVTSHDSEDGFREFVGGLKDGGTLELAGNFDIEDAGQVVLAEGAGDTEAVVVTYSDGSTSTFSVVIGAFAVTNPLDDKLTFSCSCKITGPVVYAEAA